jgi:hypothetical protein
VWDNEEDFKSGSIVLAKVTSTVEDLGGVQYLYTYTISQATEKFTGFVIAIDPSVGASIVSPGFSSLVSSWVLTDDGDAMVATIIGNLKTSGAVATVWFTCSQLPTSGDGALSNVKSYAQGSIATPIPEPMTIILLSAGWLMLRSCKRKLIFHKKQT